MAKHDPNLIKQRSWSFGMAFVAFIAVFIFGPRLTEPRYIGEVRFTTKSGGEGLTNLGLILLIVLPLAAFLITRLIFHLRKSPTKKQS